MNIFTTRDSVSEGQKKKKRRKNRWSSPSCRLPLLHFSCPVHPRLLARDLSPRRLHPLISAPASTAPPPTTSNPASPSARFPRLVSFGGRPSAPTASALLLLRDLAGPSGAGLGIRAHGVAARPHPGETPAWSCLRSRALWLYGDTVVASNLRSWDWGLCCWGCADMNNVCVYLVGIHGYLGSCLWGCLCWRNMQATDFGQTMIQFAFCNRYYFPLVIERIASFSLACICMNENLQETLDLSPDVI